MNDTDWDHFDGLLGMPTSELHGMTTGALAAVVHPEAALSTLVRMLDLDEAMLDESLQRLDEADTVMKRQHAPPPVPDGVFHRSLQRLDEADTVIKRQHARPPVPAGVFHRSLQRLDEADTPAGVFHRSLQRLDEADTPAGVFHRSALGAFVSAVVEDLRSEDLGFSLLLPDDEAPMAMRLEHLGRWCAGFVAGFTYAADETALADDVAEALGDLKQIGEVDPDSVEGSEFEYFAVAEHARIAALLIHARGEDDDDDE